MEQTVANLNGSTYTGSRMFSHVAEIAGLPIDQFNFLLSEVLALIFAMCFRRFLPPNQSNVLKRHVVASLLGIALSYFCFGAQIWHLVAQSCIAYLMLCFIAPKHSYLVVFAFCMIYMSAIHIHRLIYDYGNYTLDISGPLMINTQKLTALAFAFYDGYRSKLRSQKRRSNEDQDHHLVLTEDQEKQKIIDVPDPIVYLSYIFYFHGIIVGPLCFFKDYCNFIEGHNLLVIPVSKEEIKSDEEQKPVIIEQPSIFWPVVTKLAQCALWGYILIVYTPYYPVEYNLSQEMLNSPWFKRLCFLLFTTFCARVKYYFAFILSEAVNNAAGLGFNGFDKKGAAKWNLLTNVQPLDLELATSLKTVIDAWNMQTAIWLRRVCYDRLRNGRTLGVFVLSAVWHGFYPGYYVCFILAAFQTYAGRGIRRQIRPYFQKNQATICIYACITWFGTQVGLNFDTVPFVLMEIQKVWIFYKSWYFIVPIISVILALTLKGASSKPSKKQEASEDKQKVPSK